MTRIRFAAAALLFALSPWGGSAVHAVELQQTQLQVAPPVNGVPRWYTIPGGTTGGQATLVLARSVTTGQPLGYLAPGYRFLSFGTNEEIITFALAGQIAYVPVNAVTELYPVQAVGVEWKAYGPTLEDRAEQERKAAKAAQSRGLEPLSFKKKAAERAAQQAMPGGAVPVGVPAVGGGGGDNRSQI